VAVQYLNNFVYCGNHAAHVAYSYWRLCQLSSAACDWPAVSVQWNHQESSSINSQDMRR